MRGAQPFRGFLPWRLPDAGPGARGCVAMGRHPKPYTGPDLRSEPVAFLPEVDKRMSACATTVQQTPPERTFMGLLKA